MLGFLDIDRGYYNNNNKNYKQLKKWYGRFFTQGIGYWHSVIVEILSFGLDSGRSVLGPTPNAAGRLAMMYKYLHGGEELQMVRPMGLEA